MDFRWEGTKRSDRNFVGRIRASFAFAGEKTVSGYAHPAKFRRGREKS
jgi:hypothetical protein